MGQFIEQGFLLFLEHARRLRYEGHRRLDQHRREHLALLHQGALQLDLFLALLRGLLTGQCIRFPVTDVRVFKGRDSMGVRGINLGAEDTVISLAILRHVEASPAEREAYLKMRRAIAGEAVEETGAPGLDETVEEGSEEAIAPAQLPQDRYVEMSLGEQVILCVSSNGYGKRTSSYEYRITGRGGKGITAMTVNRRNGPLVAALPVEHGDEIMLVTNGGQLIRCPV
ncbi:MAG: hypothetical protein B7Z83_11980, partial [Thiomonas sp. 20-64-5]